MVTCLDSLTLFQFHFQLQFLTKTKQIIFLFTITFFFPSWHLEIEVVWVKKDLPPLDLKEWENKGRQGNLKRVGHTSKQVPLVVMVKDILFTQIQADICSNDPLSGGGLFFPNLWLSLTLLISWLVVWWWVWLFDWWRVFFFWVYVGVVIHLVCV